MKLEILVLGLVVPMVVGGIIGLIAGIIHEKKGISHAIFFDNNLKRKNHEVMIGNAMKHFKLADEFRN